jgi:hypothetical protein
MHCTGLIEQMKTYDKVSFWHRCFALFLNDFFYQSLCIFIRWSLNSGSFGVHLQPNSISGPCYADVLVARDIIEMGLRIILA